MSSIEKDIKILEAILFASDEPVTKEDLLNKIIENKSRKR